MREKKPIFEKKILEIFTELLRNEIQWLLMNLSIYLSTKTYAHTLTHTRRSTHTHTHTHAYIYIYIYISSDMQDIAGEAEMNS